MAAPTDNGSGPAPTGAAGPYAQRPQSLQPPHLLRLPRPFGYDFLLGEADGDGEPGFGEAVFGATEAVGF